VSPSQLSGKSSSLYYGVIIQVNLCWPAPPVKIGAKFNCPHALADDDSPAVREISGENLVRENWSLLTSSLGLRQAVVATDLHGMEIVPTPQVLCPSLHVPILPISATLFSIRTPFPALLLHCYPCPHPISVRRLWFGLTVCAF